MDFVVAVTFLGQTIDGVAQRILLFVAGRTTTNVCGVGSDKIHIFAVVVAKLFKRTLVEIWQVQKKRCDARKVEET